MRRHCQGVSSVRREQTSRRKYVRTSGLQRKSNSQPVVLNFDEPGGERIESTRVLRRRQRDQESFEAPRAKLSVNVIERLENCPSCSDASGQKKSISAENADEAHSSPSCADDVQPLEVDELPPVTHQVSNEHGDKENTNKNAHSLESEVKLEQLVVDVNMRQAPLLSREFKKTQRVTENECDTIDIHPGNMDEVDLRAISTPTHNVAELTFRLANVSAIAPASPTCRKKKAEGFRG
ncbi:hypothetical protein AB6A40_006560 [Gnathostoma spinigerum]|uniref:Uncharacterized protein n=1 Tax=Gnathostoma spinigerum TaxID=75299 RepID=A0ABD6EJC2_9BILA